MKHPSVFPFFVLLLSALLVGGFLFASTRGVLVSSDRFSTLNLSAYRASLTALMRKFVASYDTASDDSARKKVVEQTMTALLSMRVPASEKQLHLDTAVALQKMKQGFVGDPQDVSDGYAELKQIIAQTTWLRL